MCGKSAERALVEVSPIAPICLDVEAAAAAVGVSASVIRGWIERGLLPVVKFPSTRRPGELSRRVLVAVDDLREFVRRHRETTGAH